MSKKTTKNTPASQGETVEQNVEQVVNTPTAIVLPTSKKRREMTSETLTIIGEKVLQGKTRGQILKELKESTNPELEYTDVYMAVLKLQKANPGLKVNTREEKPFKQEVFKLKAEGLTCKEIAEKLGLEYSQIYSTYIRDPKLG